MITFDELFCGGYQYLVSPSGEYGNNVMCDCNSVGGVSVFANIRNSGPKTVKYIEMEVTPINAVGDEVFCTIGNGCTRKITFTGPLSPGCQSGRIQWENMWYNSTIKRMTVGPIEVTYMDGTKESVKFQRTDSRILNKEHFINNTLPGLIGIGMLVGVVIFIISLF
ncbi:MAG: hypothetical protein E7324_09160 [Clostridiales bacterium]|nr:hypothetical protein [Clostridiales bacterium]